ncbi:MAG: glycosyltransferase [Pseudomonadota bacterium]
MTANRSRLVCGTLQLVTGLGVGGAERVVLGLARGLAARGEPVAIAVINGEERRLLEQYPEMSSGIEFLGARRESLLSLIVATVRLVRLVRDRDIKIIHAHMFHALVLALVARLLVPGTRVVFTSHSFSGFSGMRERLIRMTRKWRDADVVFSPLQHPGLNTERTVVIPNGVVALDEPVIRQPRSDGGFVFLAVGRLDAPKDPERVVAALAAMHCRHCEAWFAGEGPLREDIVALAQRLGVADRVKLLGVRKDVPQLLQQADCLVMPSRWEGLPMALLEAGSSGIPVIATGVGAIPEVLGGGCGYVKEPAQFAAAMDYVIEHYDEALAAGSRLRLRVDETYSLDSMVNAHTSLYRALVGLPVSVA